MEGVEDLVQRDPVLLSGAPEGAMLRGKSHFFCRLQYVRRGHWGLSLWLLENNEVEP